jgi:hypothetical protein
MGARVVSKPGRLRVALAEKLQAQFPSLSVQGPDGSITVIPLLFEAEKLYPATGYYRTDSRADVWRWEGTVQGVRADGRTFNLQGIGGYTTMTELCRKGDLTWHPDGEITRSAE